MSQEKKSSQVKSSDEKDNPRRNFDTKLFIASFLLFVVSLIVLAIAMSIASERTRLPSDGLPIGRAVTVGSSTLTVSKVQHKPGVHQFVAPDGYEYLVLSLSVRNNSERPFSVLPTSDTYIKTDTGKVSYLTPYELTNPYHSGLVLPGESTAGELSYLVPKVGNYKFYVEAGWSATAVPFVVQSTDTNHKQDTR